MERVSRTQRRMVAAKRDYEKWQVEHDLAEIALREAQEALKDSRAVDGRSYARFDRQTLVWMIDAQKLAEHMQPKMRQILEIVFDGDLKAERSVTMTGVDFRTKVQVNLATRSAEPLRMYHCFRSEFIRRGLLRYM